MTFRVKSMRLIERNTVDSPPSEDGYKNITSSTPLPSGAPSFTFLDSYMELSTRNSENSSLRQSAPYGPSHTYTGFKGPGNKETKRIDFIMVASAHDPQIEPSENDAKDQKAIRGGWEFT